ncbi:trigger factor [Candidatus Similichlamydia epinepheli]|uniref:trigger factor n=1 Tax=Candidatus Similichlamydia epinepheli TaxID=1903953 RepID=UPI0013005339|nr:trigger factor [Candidatus Similichlamydia epinepheli]
MKKNEIADCSISVLSKVAQANCRFEFVLSVPASFAIDSHRQSVEQVAKTVSLPGFRKGKVPKDHVLQSFGEKIDREWQDSLAKKTVNIFLEQQSFRAIPPIVYSWKKLDQESDLELHVSFEVYPKAPEIEEIDLSSVSFPDRKEVTDGDVEKKIDEYRAVLAEWTPLDDMERICEEDRTDYRLISLSGNEAKKERGCLVKEMPDTIRKAILSSSDKKLEVDLPQNWGNVPGGKYFLETYNRARKIPPPVDESFAKRFNMSSVDELKNEIRKKLNISIEFDHIEEAKNILQEALVKKLSFELPLTILEKEVESRASFSSNKGLKKEEIEEQARQALRLFFLIESIAMRHGISLSQESRDFIWSQNQPGLQGESGRQRMAAQLIQHEVLLFLLQRMNWLKPNN